MSVIYIDVLMALNLFIDFLLLSVTARLLRRPKKRGRLLLGALCGAACACLIFMPEMPMAVSMLFKLGAAAIIVKIAFAWTNWLCFLQEMVVFFLSGTVFAGVAYALWFFAAPEGFYLVNGIVYYDVSPLMLVVLTVVSYGALCLYERFTRKKAPVDCDYRLLLDFGEGSVSLKALYDTGNHLTETFSGSPVAVVNISSVRSVLPAEVLSAVKALSGGEEKILSPTAGGIRLVPYQSVGGKGLLPAFKPRKMTLLSLTGGGCDVTGSYVALCETIARGQYEALIGNELVEMATSAGSGNVGERGGKDACNKQVSFRR